MSLFSTDSTSLKSRGLSGSPWSRGVRGGGKLRQLCTSCDQLTQSPICSRLRTPEPRLAVTGDQYSTVQSITAHHHVGTMFVN